MLRVFVATVWESTKLSSVNFFCFRVKVNQQVYNKRIYQDDMTNHSGNVRVILAKKYGKKERDRHCAQTNACVLNC